jgi:tRNA dimethylallyltransferase
VQIYRYFDIGSNKPTAEEQARVPHHLVSAIDPFDAMDAGLFAERASQVIADVRARGRLPILCGGTFLWVRAVVYGLAKAPPKSDELRLAHRALVAQEGRAALHARLQAIDAHSYAKLLPNDFVRVSRALEVFELTGKPLSAFQAEHGFREPRFDVKYLGVRRSADELSARIQLRAARMLESAWIEEVNTLVQQGFRDARPMASVGYRQVLEHLERQELSLTALLEDVTRVTRVFARRQRTWLRDQPVVWVDPSDIHSFTP